MMNLGIKAGGSFLSKKLSSSAPKLFTEVMQKRHISTQVFNTKIKDGRVTDPGHINFILNAKEMQLMHQYFPKHPVTLSGGQVGFGPMAGKALATQKVPVNIEGQISKVGSVMKPLEMDAKRKSTTPKVPDASYDHGTLSFEQLQTLLSEHDQIHKSGTLYRTDVFAGRGFPGSGLEDKRTINCVGAHSQLGETFGMPSVTELNATPQKRGKTISVFML